MKKYPIFILFLIVIRLNITAQVVVPNFIIPDTVCVNQSFTIQNTTTGASSYYWNFCSGNLSNNPIGLNMGNLGSLNQPVFSAIAKDGNNYYVFITNIYDGTLTRLSFGNSLINTPVATNLGTFGVLGMYINDINIKKDSLTGNWYGFVLGGQNNYIARLNFGTSLNNTPTAVNLGNINNVFSHPFSFYTFNVGGNWYSIILNSGSLAQSSIIRMSFGNSLSNTPTAVNLGNIGSLNSPGTFSTVYVNGMWYLFVVNTNNNTISRLDFGNSLLNTPTGINLGDINNTFYLPRSVTMYQDCGQPIGFVTNETTNDIVRLTFPSGITSTPTGVSLGNIGNIDFPHSISEIFRVGDSLYSFIMNVNSSTITRLCFPSCINASIPSSTLQNPPPISYNTPGTYNINLSVNEGLPSQTSFCNQIVVVAPPIVNLGNDTTLNCGSQLTLNAGNPGASYLWNTGATTQQINVSSSGAYWVKVTNSGGCTGSDTINVTYTNPTADFNIPDTVCVNTSFNIQNLSSCVSSYYWNFCSGNLNNPIGLNMGNLGSLNQPVFSAIAKDGNNYYVFITNIYDGTLTRLSFGNSLINTPVATNLGTLGVLSMYIEGIQINKDSLTGNWYGLIISRQNNTVIRLSFGTSLANTPVATDLGNIGNLMNYALPIYTFNEGGNWYSFVGNYNINNSSIIRLNFGNSLANTPSATNLGNVGGLYGLTDFRAEQENGMWYLFAANSNNNTISRLDFGNSLLNTPTGVNLGNINNTFNYPRSITIYKDCGQVVGYVTNVTNNNLVRLTFPNGITSIPTGDSLGNIANFDFPHSISEIFRVGDSLYCFVMNVYSSTISRLCFPSCTNASIASSTLQNPPPISYNTPGTYNINLSVNEGLPSQTSFCNQIVVVAPPTDSITGTNLICQGDSIKLYSNVPNGYSCQWSGPNGFSSINQNIIIPNATINNSGYYKLIISTNGCSNIDSIYINVISTLTVNLGNDTTICQGNSIILNAGNTGATYLWNTNATTQQINVTISGTYSVKVTNSNGCVGMDTIIVTFTPLYVNLGNDTNLCIGNTLTLDAGNTGSTYLWNTNATTQQINVSTTGSYWVKVTNSNGCTGTDTINVTFSPLSVNIGNDTTLCLGDTITLNAGNAGGTYLWNTGFTTQTIKVWNAGSYWVQVNWDNCNNSDTININTVQKPVVNLGNDTIMCPGDLIVLSAGTGFTSYLWSNGSTQSTLNVNNPGTYWVTVSNNGCLAGDSIIIAECNSEIWIPNCFTPNGDGINDTFYPVCTNIDELTMYVYNRWGNEIFEGKEKAAIWDGTYKGKMCSVGVYYYLIIYQYKGNGHIEMKELHGSVTLLR